MSKKLIYSGWLTPVLWGIFFLSISMATNIYADTTEDEQVFTLGEIVVTGERLVKESPTTISVVTADEISRQNAQDLGEALSLLPGVHFRQGRTKQGLYVSIRGFEQDKVLILLDGVPIYEPYEGLLNLSDIPVQNIAEIKVVKGLASALYGPNTMGGVINIITKKGTTTPKTTLSYQVSDYNTHHAEISHGWKVGDFGYYLAYSHKESDGFKLAEDYSFPEHILTAIASSPSPISHTPPLLDSGLRDNSDYKRDAVTFTGTYDINDSNEIGVSFEYYTNEYGVPPTVIYRETRSAGGTAHWYPRYWRFDDWERYTVNLIGESRISDSLRIKGRFFYDDYENVLNAYDDPTFTTMDRAAGAPSGSSLYDDYNTGFSINAFWDGITNNSIRAGFNLKKDVHRSVWNTDAAEILESYTYSGALEDEITISDGLVLTIGASYDTFDKKKREQSSGTDTGDDVHSFSPQMGVSYDLSDSVNLFASAGKKIRFPTMRNLYSDGVIGPQGDPNLEKESTYAYESGGKWIISDNVIFEGTLFYNDIENLIIFDNQIGRFEQYSDAKSYGLELSMDLQITQNLLGRISYTYLVAKNDGSTVFIEYDYLPGTGLSYVPDEIPYRPKHKIDMDFTYSFDNGIKISLNGSYLSRQFYYDKEDTTDNTVFTAKKRSLDGYLLLNTKISYDFMEHYQAFIAVDNILDEEYQDIYLSPEPGLAAWLGIKFEI